MLVQFQSQPQQQHQEGAPAAAPAATPAPAAPTAPAPILPPPADDDDAIIADLRREHFEKEGIADDAVEAPEPEDKPKVKDKGKPKAEKSPYNPEGLRYKTPAEAVSAIVAAVESGDPKKLAKALGKPETFLDVSTHKWAAFRERSTAVVAREKKVAAREAEFSGKLSEARAEVGTALKAREAYRDGKYGEFVTLVSELAGEPYDEAQRKVIKGELAMSPDVKRLRDELAQERAERRREASEREAREASQTATVRQQTAMAQAVDAVTSELAGHPVAKLRNFQRLVLDRVRESFDPGEKTYTMSFQDAAEAIMDDKLADAEALGAQRPKPSVPAQRAPSPRPIPRVNAGDARAPEEEPWASKDMSDDEIIASIKRDVRSGRIRVT